MTEAEPEAVKRYARLDDEADARDAEDELERDAHERGARGEDAVEQRERRQRDRVDALQGHDGDEELPHRLPASRCVARCFPVGPHARRELGAIPLTITMRPTSRRTPPTVPKR